MAKIIKKQIDKNVYEMAKERIRYVLKIYDHVWVSFSGGKDSLTVLKLLEEVYQEQGITNKINVIFRDEELIQDDVIKFVDEIYRSRRYNFRYYAVQQQSQKYVLGSLQTYIQWDEKRKWIRSKPDYAIKGNGKIVFSQLNMERYMLGDIPGKIALLNGIRADESLIRYRSCISKVHENYICSTRYEPVQFVKPIYDWSEKDVFKYFHDKGIKYCSTYDVQVLNDQPLRVATPLLAESAKQFHKLRTAYPVFYQQVIDIFPDMLLQERYYRELDRYSIIDKYEHSWNGIVKMVKDLYPDSIQQNKMISYVKSCRSIRRNKMKEGSGNLGGYPLLHVFKAVINGGKQRIQAKINPSKADLEFEELI